MEITRLAEMRPRFVWDIVDDAFDLYRERFALLCGIAACVTLPVTVLTVLYTVSGMNKITALAKNDPSASLDYLLPLLLIALPLTFALRVLQTGATAIAVEAVLNGKKITVGEAYKRVFKRFGPMAGGMLTTSFLVTVSICVGGIGFAFSTVLLNFVGPAITIENRGAWSAIQRSSQIAAKEWIKVLGVLLLIWLLTTISWLSFYLSVEGLFKLIPTHGAAQNLQKSILIQSATALVTVFLDSLSAIVATLLYYDLRVRREGLDIAAAAQETGVTLAPDPFGDLPSEVVSRQMARYGGNLGMPR